MFIILFIFVFAILLLKEEMENQSYREECRKHEQQIGLDFYASSTGLRNTKTGEKYYK